MNPVLKFCGYYCAALLVVGIGFFAILLILEQTYSPYLTQGKTDEDVKSTSIAIGVAMGVFLFYVNSLL